MADKILVLDSYEDKEGYRNMTLLSGNANDEVIYAEFHSNVDKGADPDVVELAVNLGDMKRMRDFLNTIIEKVERNYEAD